ncbi:hypothetical protein ACOV11_25350, partial [Vibrio natriegens]
MPCIYQAGKYFFVLATTIPLNKFVKYFSSLFFHNASVRKKQIAEFMVNVGQAISNKHGTE